MKYPQLFLTKIGNGINTGNKLANTNIIRYMLAESSNAESPGK